MKTLQTLIEEWDNWAATADRSEDGWESDFPDWQMLMNVAWQTQYNLQNRTDLPLLEKCWAISSESEEFPGRLKQLWSVLDALSSSELTTCRWQVYEAVAAEAVIAERLLRNGLSDVDPYARRRAILNIARLRPRDAYEIAIPLLAEPDPYIRQASITLVCSVDDREHLSPPASLSTTFTRSTVCRAPPNHR